MTADGGASGHSPRHEDETTGLAGPGKHSHTLDKTVYAANQIAREFAGQRPHDAVEATWDHIWHFWDPRTRAMILAHLAAGGAGLSEVARKAIEKLRDEGVPQPQTKATEFNQAGDHATDRNLMSDAG